MLSRQSLMKGPFMQSSQYTYGNVDCKTVFCSNHGWWQHGAIKDEEKLLCHKRRFKPVTTDSTHGLPIYPNLLKKQRNYRIEPGLGF